MVYLGTCSSHLLKACRRGPLQWPGLQCAGSAGLILKLARLAHQDYCMAVVLYTIHGWAKNIPEEIDFDNLLDIAISCDYYDSAAAMNP